MYAVIMLKSQEDNTFAECPTFLSKFIALIAKHQMLKKNGVKSNGKQNFFCNACCKQFQYKYKYKYQGADPRIKRQIPNMAMRASGIRDIATVLKISAVTVILTLRLWFKIHTEPQFESIYENVLLDEFWSWVGKRKQGKGWVWYAYSADSGKILAFQVGKRNDATCKKLFKKLEHLTINKYYIDDWKSYKKYIPSEKHIISKKKTQKIERQNLNFRTHIKRLCRKTICFSKKDDMHFGFIKAYIWLKNHHFFRSTHSVTLPKILVQEVSRLGRSMVEVLKVLKELTNFGVSVYVQNFGIETLKNNKRSPVAQFMFTLLAEFARLE